MAELLKTYSLAELITILVTCALAIKGLISFFDWSKDRLSQYFNKENEKNKKMEEIDERFNKMEEREQILEDKEADIEKSIASILEKLNLLIDSDKDDIKAYITREHHYFMKEKWIDDYSLDCIERRYEHYVHENGNSFVKDLMMDLRKLPK